MDRAIVYNNLGTACLNGKEYEDALYYLKRSAQLYSQYEEGEHERQLGILYRNLSLCYLHLGDYEKSHEEIGKCCELYKKLIHTDKERNRAYFSEYTMALASKADVYLKQKRIFSAIKYGINAYMFLWWTVVKWLFKKL
jgi:tetratricopeptide (TPR) repeat protein